MAESSNHERAGLGRKFWLEKVVMPVVIAVISTLLGGATAWISWNYFLSEEQRRSKIVVKEIEWMLDVVAKGGFKEPFQVRLLLGLLEVKHRNICSYYGLDKRLQECAGPSLMCPQLECQKVRGELERIAAVLSDLLVRTEKVSEEAGKGSRLEPIPSYHPDETRLGLKGISSIYIQAPFAESKKAESLRQRLIGNFLPVPPVEYFGDGARKTVAKLPDTPQIRYFHEQDQGKAASLGNLIASSSSCGQWKMHYLPAYSNKVPLGQLEVWFPRQCES